MVVGRMGSVMRLLPLSRVQNRSFRAGPVLKWHEMQIVACAVRDLAQQRAVHPVHDRTVEFSWTVKSHTVIGQIRDENVLHLQIAARMEQRQRISKTFQRAGTEMESQLP